MITQEDEGASLLDLVTKKTDVPKGISSDDPEPNEDEEPEEEPNPVINQTVLESFEFHDESAKLFFKISSQHCDALTLCDYILTKRLEILSEKKTNENGVPYAR